MKTASIGTVLPLAKKTDRDMPRAQYSYFNLFSPRNRYPACFSSYQKLTIWIVFRKI